MFEQKTSHITSGAFLSGWKRFKILNTYNKGWVVENAENRIPLSLSTRGTLLISSTGGGKSTTMTAINLLRLTENPCSICCLDPSGDMMRLVAPALRMKGVDVQVFEPAKPNQSMKFNPFSGIDSTDRTSIQEIASIIIRSAFPQSNSESQFWENGAIQLLSVLIEAMCTCLPVTECTLQKLYFYLNIFQSRREEINQLAIQLPETSYSEFLGIVSAEPKMLNSFLSTCKVALKLMGSQDVCNVTAETSFDISDMRRKPTCLFLVVEEFQLKTFAFLSTLFMHSVMKHLMQHKTDALSPYLNQFLIWDEFANAMTYNEMIPSFLSTCRKKRISTLVMLQSEQQVFQHYSHSEGQIILDNLNTQIYYPGVLNVDTLKRIQTLLGTHTKQEFSWWKGFENDNEKHPKEKPLMSLEAIRTMKNKGLLITSNLPPVLISPKPFYKSRWCKNQIKRGKRGES